MVTDVNNHNKYYKQIPHGDVWTAEYGRVGGTPQTRTYSMRVWDSKYREKLRKGYIDQSELISDLVTVEKRSKYKEIENPAIAEIVARLQQMAIQVIADNYTISSNSVTQAMVDEAQNILASLLTITDVKTFNDSLLGLFRTIPRKMNNVNRFLAASPSDFPAIIQAEQDILDVMRGQVVQNAKTEPAPAAAELPDKTVLDAMGLIFEECDDKDIHLIKKLLGSCADKFKAAWRVTNKETQRRFDGFVGAENITNIKLLWHGSRNENWWSILGSGLVLRPTNAVITGKLYGNGCYFAPKARKSLGYTSLSGSYWARGKSDCGFMALMAVAYGVPYDVYNFDSRYHRLDYAGLQKFKIGANCLHAHAGANMGGFSPLKNDEIVVYREDQMTIKYLVELRRNG